MRTALEQRLMLAASKTMEAAVGAASWQEAIKSVVDVTDAGGGAFFRLNRATCQITEWEWVNLNDTDRYREEMNAINPRMHYSLAREQPHVVTDRHFISEPRMERHDFYHWLRRDSGYRHFIGARLSNDGDVSTFFSVEYPHHCHSPPAEMIDRFSALARHITVADELSRNRLNSGQPDTVEGFLGDATTTALLFLNEQLALSFANRAGDSLLSNGTLVRQVGGHVRFSDPAADRLLQLHLEQSRINASGWRPVAPIPLRSNHGAIVAMVRLTHLAFPLHGPGGIMCRACLLIKPLTAGVDRSTRLLTDAFGLTCREQDLIEAIYRYHSVSDAAVSLDMAPNTGRVHMRNIFRKIGIRSQNELVRLIDSLGDWDVN